MKAKDVLTAEQFTREDLSIIIDKAAQFSRALKKSETIEIMKNNIMATLFFEPSTRTRFSFETAMLRMGGKVISMADADSSSVAKGESLCDTICSIHDYVDIIVLRHPEIGSAQLVAEVAECPVINAGDGSGQHPTQALLDIYTIRQEKGRIDGLTIALAGDLKHGRTVHSLAQVLSLYNVKLLLVSPLTLRMPEEIVRGLENAGVIIEQTQDLHKALYSCDVLYITRVQRERFVNTEEYENLKGVYVLTKEMIKIVDKDITIMHPLPRVNEIDSAIDEMPAAVYFRQAANGVPVRMALLSLIIGE